MYNFEAAYPLIFRQRELFNILLSERRLRHRELCNKFNLMRKFDIVHIVVVTKQVNSSRKDRMSTKILFKAKGNYIFLEKDTPSSYWLQRLNFWEGPGRPGITVKESAARLENIPSTIVLQII